MKRILCRSLCLTLALVMVLTLASCEKKDDFTGVADRLVDVDDMPSPTEDPAAFLKLNAQNTLAVLEKRYEASPLAALAKIEAASGRLDLSLAGGGTIGGVSASLAFDRTAGRARLDASLESGGGDLSVGLYADGDFVGLYIPDFLGEGFFGFSPTGIYEQASGSALGELMGDEVLSALKEAEEMMASARTAPKLSREELEKRGDQLLSQLFSSAVLTVEKESVRRDGVEDDGCVVALEMDSAAMADLLERTYELFPEISMDDETRRSIADLRASGVRCRAELMADGYLVSVDLTFTDTTGSEGAVSVNFFDDSAESVAITGSEGSVTVRSLAETDGGGWSHTLTVDNNGESATVSTTYGGDGKLSVSLASPGRNGGFSGDLKITDAGFTLDEVSVTSDNATKAIPLTVTFTAGGTVEKPTDTKNIFSLDETELRSLLLTAYMALGLTV